MRGPRYPIKSHSEMPREPNLRGSGAQLLEKPDSFRGDASSHPEQTSEATLGGSCTSSCVSSVLGDTVERS